ncbi:MAG: ATP-dependent metallopeptidase FtsH/Yme1/Tma family protein, partial [Maioricimonas sp. JB049]
MSSETPESQEAQKPSTPPGTRNAEDAPRGGLPIFWLIVLFFVVSYLLYYFQTAPEHQGTEVEYGFFLEQLEEGNVEHVTFQGSRLTGKWEKVPENPAKEKDAAAPELEPEFNTEIPLVEDRTVLTALVQQNSRIRAVNRSPGLLTEVFIYSLPLLVMLGLFIFLMR